MFTSVGLWLLVRFAVKVEPEKLMLTDEGAFALPLAGDGVYAVTPEYDMWTVYV
jgi:hypothetical protein